MQNNLGPYPRVNHVLLTENNQDFIHVQRFQGDLKSKDFNTNRQQTNQWQLIYMCKGQIELNLDFEPISLEAGTLVIIHPMQIVQWKITSKWEAVAIGFNPNESINGGWMPTMLHQFPFLGKRYGTEQLMVIPKENRTALQKVLDGMCHEATNPDQWANVKLSTDLIQLFVFLSRCKATPSNQMEDVQTVLLHNFQELIERFYKDLKLPKEYAELLYITPNHLNALCKELREISAGELIRNRIVLEAKRLLCNPNQSVNEIAAALNFQDASYFVKFFKKYTSYTPDQFRKNSLT